MGRGQIVAVEFLVIGTGLLADIDSGADRGDPHHVVKPVDHTDARRAQHRVMGGIAWHAFGKRLRPARDHVEILDQAPVMPDSLLETTPHHGAVAAQGE
jgi:hypothetical protein